MSKRELSSSGGEGDYDDDDDDDDDDDYDDEGKGSDDDAINTDSVNELFHDSSSDEQSTKKQKK